MNCYESQGASIPLWDHDAFSPLFQISPLFSKKFQTLRKIFTIFPFPTNFLIFIRQNFWWLFFSHRPQILNFPYFSCFSTFPPLFRENYYSPYFTKFPPCFRQIHLLFTYFTCISFPPYFDHDASMHHHPMHVLDAPGSTPSTVQNPLQSRKSNQNSRYTVSCMTQPINNFDAFQMCPLILGLYLMNINFRLS